MSAIRTGYIRGFWTDLFWFLGLPYLAIAAALCSEIWLPFAAVVSVNLWITIPHHFSSWFRAYGLPEDWARFKGRLILGPILIFGATLAGIYWAPLTAVLALAVWDHQHSMMQQHGFARIYDFKAKAGAPQTGKFDLWLGIVLYVNLILTAPLWAENWIAELYRWQFPVSAETVRSIQTASWTVVGVYGLIYIRHLSWCSRNGYALNPIKYLFIFSSYFLWYFTSWHTNSLLIYGIAHRLMHGLQYIVIVYWYMDNKAERTENKPKILSHFNVWKYIAYGLTYAFFFQLIVQKPLFEFGFGIPGLFTEYPGVPAFGIEGITDTRAYDLFAASIVSSTAMLHYYYDSFIWKVSDAKTQEGL